MHDGQAEAGAFTLRFLVVKNGSKMCSKRGCLHSVTIVANRQAHVPTPGANPDCARQKSSSTSIGLREMSRHASVVFHGMSGIGGEIQNDLLDLPGNPPAQ